MNNPNFNSNKYPNQYLSQPNLANNTNMPTNGGAQPNMFYNSNNNNNGYPMQSYMPPAPPPPMNPYQMQQMGCHQFGYNQVGRYHSIGYIY